MPDVLQFVDQIAASPTVRLNLNDGVTWCDIEGTEFQPPPLREVAGSTNLADGANVGAGTWDRRVCNLRLAIDVDACAATGGDVATQVQSFATPAGLAYLREPHA